VSILNTEEIYEKLNSCNKCGFCQATCRVYKETLSEFNCARGRLKLIKAVADSILERNKFYEDAVNSCTLCLECTKTCPSGVPTAQLILAARQDLAETRGLSFPKKIALKRILANNSLRKISFKSAKMVKGLKRLHGFRGIDVAGLPVSEVAFLDTVDKLPRLKNPKSRAAFFVGCMFNHSLVDTAHNLVKVLHANNVEVIIPGEQLCCGTPQLVYGEVKTFNTLAKHNIDLFNKLNVDAVVTGCASCGGMLKTYKDNLDKNNKEEANNLASKVKDINEYLVDVLKIDLSGLQGLYGKVTYHDPCYLIRAQGITAQPRKLLKELPGIEYIEMQGANNCCGAGGMFQGFYPEIAVPITQKKIDSIVKTGADTVITSCPACKNRIQGSLNLGGHKYKVLHIVDLLARAYENEQYMAAVR
jgi:glycolate oxidase iron-sulfur subunit